MTPRSVAPESAQLPYVAPAGVHDLMRGPNGETREGWERLESYLAALAGGGPDQPSELAARQAHAQAHIRRNGVTYNEFADPAMAHRPWTVDPVPITVAPRTWGALELGLEQRARLMDALLRDIYGAQRVLTEKLVPPELVFGNPGFLRPCHRLLPAQAPMLTVHGAELAWNEEGRLCVLADGTQAPSGAAYALENRLIVSQVLAREFRGHQVRRLAEFFDEYRKTLRGLPTYARENPLIVVLTPGPYTQSYFEHAFLASYLGLTLVQGADLAVRDHRVYLKTLGGLERVDVILRRVDDRECDPLDLDGQSSVGVAGLTQAVRAGNVAVANALGTGVLQTRAFLGYLPTICRALLGEELRLASAETYWCGERAARKLVLDQLPQMIVGPTFPGSAGSIGSAGEGSKRVAAGQLAKAELDELRAAIEARPNAFVAQRAISLGTSPSWVEGAIAPRPVILRTFAVRTGSGYRVMPGGLVRVASRDVRSEAALQSGTTSKDCWVQSDGPVAAGQSLLRRAAGPLAISRAGGDLPSRIADDLFWLGRYVERADETARLLRVLTANLADQSTSGGATVLPALVHALAIHTEEETRLDSPPSDGDLEPLERQIVDYLLSEDTPRSLRSLVTSARRVAFAARDRISHDALRALQGASDAFAGEEFSKEMGFGVALELIDQVLMALAAFAGMGFDGLTRGAGYRFADMGRRVERAYGTARLIGSTLGNPLADATGEGPQDEEALLLALLTLLDSTGAYRRRYRGALDAAAVLDLLVLDERNPRSLGYQLAALEEHLSELPGSEAREHRRPEARVVLRALTRLRLTDAAALAELGGATNDRDRSARDSERTELQRIMRTTAEDMAAFSDALTTAYFAHAVPQLSVSRSEEPSQ